MKNLSSKRNLVEADKKLGFSDKYRFAGYDSRIIRVKRLKIVFIIDRIGFLDNFSIPLLSSLAKRRGHQVKLVEFSPNQGKACHEIISWEPDIIAYSLCSDKAKRYLEINNMLKSKADFFSLFGGPHPTFFPSFIKEKGVDAICRGEGDITFPQFLDTFSRDEMYETNNFSFKNRIGEIVENPLTGLIPDLDELPFPDRDLIFSKSPFLADSPVKSFFAGRGCPYNCTYCFNHAFNAMYKGKGKILRTKSIDYLLSEIKELANKYPLSFIKFQDDIFGANREWLAEFAERYPLDIGLPFLCLSRPNMITGEYCRLLKKSGCFSVCIAFECGNEQIRHRVINRKITNEQIISACENLKKFGLRIYTLNMVGLPGESYDEIFQTIELNQKLGVDFADASIFQPYPGTQVNEYCIKNGYLNEGFDAFESQYTVSVLNFDKELKDRIYILHKLFSIIVDYPGLKKMLNLLFKLKKFPFVVGIINIVHRFYYGFMLHRRVFASKIPLITRVRGSFYVLFSKNRT